MFGLFKSSNNTGFKICLTDILRMSSAVRKEKEMLETVDGMEWDIFMASAMTGIQCCDFIVGNIIPRASPEFRLASW